MPWDEYGREVDVYDNNDDDNDDNFIFSSVGKVSSSLYTYRYRGS
jgi:hypothetical protein